MTIRVRHRRPPVFKPRSTLVWLEQFLFAVGFIALGYYGSVLADTYVYQEYQSWQLDENLAGRSASPTAFLRHLVTGGSGETGEQATSASTADEQPVQIVASSARKTTPRPRAQDSRLIGRIVIPRVKVSAVVREGVDNKTLRRAVGHVPGTAMPGQVGNVALAGHRDSFFTGLRDIRKGDQIQLRTLQGDFTYEVDSIRIVLPSNVEVLRTTAEPSLTLVTCYPFNYVGSAPKRYIVRAHQRQGKAAEPAPAS